MFSLTVFQLHFNNFKQAVFFTSPLALTWDVCPASSRASWKAPGVYGGAGVALSAGRHPLEAASRGSALPRASPQCRAHGSDPGKAWRPGAPRRCRASSAGSCVLTSHAPSRRLPQLPQFLEQFWEKRRASHVHPASGVAPAGCICYDREPTLTHSCHPESPVDVGVALGATRSVGLFRQMHQDT